MARKGTKRIRKAISILLYLMVSYGLIGPLMGIKAQGKQKLEVIKVAFPSKGSMDFLPFEIEKRKGFFRKEGIDLEIILMKSHISTAALNSGGVEYAGPIGDLIRASAIGVPVKVIFGVTVKHGTSLVTKPDIKSPRELKGKVLGIGAIGSTQWYAARKVVAHFGLDPDKDVTLVSVGAGMLMPSLIAGSIDATFINPVETLLAKKKGFNILIKVADIIEIPSICLGTTDRRLKENPKEVKRMLRASLSSLLIIKGNKEETIGIMMSAWGIGKDVAETVYESGIRGYSKDGIISDEGIKTHLELGKELGLIKGEVPVSKVADFSLLREVHRELGLH